MATVNRRDSILEAAALEFASAGYAGGRIERIAAAAKVNKQLIFHYFHSKDGLYSAVVHAAVSRFSLPAGPPASPPTALMATINAIVQAIEADDMLVAAVVDCSVRSGVPGEARAVVADWVRGTRRIVGEVIADGQRQGFFRDDVWPGAVAEHVVNECLGGAVHRIVRSAGIGPTHDEPSNNKTPIGAWVADYCAWR